MDDFIFDGQALSDFGYVIAADGAIDETLAVSNMNYELIKSAMSDISYKVAHEYPDNYSRTFMIIKNNCEDVESNGSLTDDDISTLTRWLVRKQFKWFKYVGTNVWFKVQNVVEKMYYGNDVIGLQITVNANAPFGFTPEIANTWSGETNTIYTVSDEEGYIIPTVIITLAESGNLVIRNSRTADFTQIDNVSSGEVITIYGEGLLQIASSDPSHNVADDFNFVFPKLVSSYNDSANIITTNLNCTVTYKYRGRRKVGL